MGNLTLKLRGLHFRNKCYKELLHLENIKTKMHNPTKEKQIICTRRKSKENMFMPKTGEEKKFTSG